MAWAQSFAKIIVIAFLIQLVNADGYPKEKPAQPFESGSPVKDNVIPSGPGYGRVVSTDYLSRYYGPVAVPVILPDGTIADTSSVSAARAAHLAALEKAKALWDGKTDDGSYTSYNSHDQATFVPQTPKNQYIPPPSQQIGSEGSLPTPTSSGTSSNQYLPPPAQATGSEDSSTQYIPPQTNSESTSNQHPPPTSQKSGVGPTSNTYLPPNGFYGANQNNPYHGPLAMTVVLPSGYIADSPANAAARAAHLQALRQALADAAKWKPQDWKAWK